MQFGGSYLIDNEYFPRRYTEVSRREARSHLLAEILGIAGFYPGVSGFPQSNLSGRPRLASPSPFTTSIDTPLAAA